MKKGIVMEGGAMRGMFTCGIVDVLLENGISFDGGAGVSAGATFGCNLKSRQHGRPLRYNKKYCRDWHYHSIRSLLTTGDIYNVRFCYDDLPYRLDPWDAEAFAENPMEFYVVATDINTGKPVYHKCSDGGREDMNWIMASASMPVVSRPVHIDGGIYLDGGTSDSIPLKFMEDKGYDRILVIETQPKDFIKQKQKYMWLVRLKLKKYPQMIKAMETRYLMYNREKQYIRKKEEAGEVYVIRPEAPLNISPIEKDENELQRVYDLGREAGLGNIEGIREFFRM